jgi:hypothetical protein
LARFSVYSGVVKESNVKLAVTPAPSRRVRNAG